MPITERDRNRLAAIIAQLKPPNSLAARLDTISDDDRAYFARWDARFTRWIEGCKAKHDDEIEIEARPYARMLEGYGPPMMRRSVEISLIGEPPTIPLHASDEQAAQIWLNEVTR
ncbi:hypothetical protein [Bradyrhizobium sp. Bra78]|uniref:hypothetical protein n=1 Tax=Bradyrhizobium sp. Bra78 TaxID=2926010 RepID=UPI0021C6A7BF|nr:hypothetical protein [Bradyrhizobium sp. Bra78]